MCVLAHTHMHTYTVPSVALTRVQLQTEGCVCCSGQGMENTNNWAAGKSPEAQSNDDKAKDQFFMLTKLHPQIFVYSFLSAYRVGYSCVHGDAKNKISLCSCRAIPTTLPPSIFQSASLDWKAT